MKKQVFQFCIVVLLIALYNPVVAQKGGTPVNPEPGSFFIRNATDGRRVSVKKEPPLPIQQSIPLPINKTSGILLTDVLDTRVLPTLNMQATVTIAINKQNPNNLVATSETYSTTASGNKGYYYSNDGGLTWTGNEQVPSTLIGLYADKPTTDFNNHNGAFIASEIDDVSGTFLSVNYSSNGGANWNNGSYAYGSIVDWPLNNCIATDTRTTGTYSGNVYMSCNFQNKTTLLPTGVMLATSIDNGVTFMPPVTLKSGPGTGSTVQTGPDGEVYACWLDRNITEPNFPFSGTGFCRSVDGGNTFTPYSRVFSYTGIKNANAPDPLFNNIKVLGLPSMAVDKSYQSTRGRIYIANNIKENGNGKAIIQVGYSDDKGSTWSTPVTVSIPTGRQNWDTRIAVDDCSGEVWVIYYSLDTPSGFTTNTYVAHSTDGGVTWDNLKVSDQGHITAPINLPGIAAGYAGWRLGIAAFGGKAYPIWSDDRTGNWQLYCSPVTSTPCNINCPSISPFGNIEYYYWNGEFTKTLQFNSSLSTGNQWYLDGVLVTGETGQSFNYTWTTSSGQTETHTITVQANGCMSTPVNVQFIYYPTCAWLQPNMNHCFPSQVNTPVGYCENSNSYMRAYDVGASGTYSWQFFDTQGQPSNSISILSQSQNQANIHLGSASTNSTAYITIISKSQFNNDTKYFEYLCNIYPASAWTNTSSCYDPASDKFSFETQGSNFDNEFYDFGNGDVVSVTPTPVTPYYVTQHTVYISGTFTNTPRKIIVKRNGISQYNTSFTNNGFDDCNIEVHNLNFLTNCTLRPVLANEVQLLNPFTVIVTPSPATGNSIKLNIKEGDKPSTKNYAVVVSNFMGAPVLKIDRYVSNTNINISRLDKGTYFAEVVNEKGEKVSRSVIKL
ncbi:MAG: T9SS type A sorting domain-containing protein [Bacteroidetes bacterium]|nr:T9SS type A sorting domain-containing protein [Bacteroidota bacterium]